MTEHSKRASTSGRPPVATPRLNQNANSNNSNNNLTGTGSGSSGAVSETALHQKLGAKITLKYRPIPSALQTTTGYIDSVSLEQHQLILREKPNVGELRLIAIASIESYTIVDPAKPETMPLPVVALNQREIETRVAKTVTSEAAAREHFGKDVDKPTQELYDALRRILPDCKWSGKSFIVNGTALVEPPYGVENVKAVEGVKGAEKNVQYVKKVLESERKKMADKAGRPGMQSPGPGGQRKGG